MLISLSSLGDLSRFVRPRDRPQLHETVLLLVDGTAISCSGTILAARSALLEKEVAKHYEVVLSGFEQDQVFQCLELLYGGQVCLKPDNIVSILRFSVQFEVEELVNLCAVWLEENDLYQECGILSESSLEKRLELVNKLDPRLRKKSAGSVADSISSSASSQPDRSSPGSDVVSAGSDVVSAANFLPQAVDCHSQSNACGTELHERVSAGVPTLQMSGSDVKLDALDTLEDFPPTAPHHETLDDFARVRAWSSNDVSPANRCPASATSPTGYPISPGDFPPLAGSKLRGWQTVQKKSKPPVTLPTFYKPKLAKWRKFTEQQVVEMCSPRCVYPDYVKMEVALGWLTASTKSTANCQALLNQLLGDINPLLLSDKYISTLAEYLRCGNKKLSLPAQFKAHVRDPRAEDDPNSKSKFMTYECVLNKKTHGKLKSRGHQSILVTGCTRCPRRLKQEIVFKLSEKSPCYDLETDNFRIKPAPDKVGIAPSHYHPDSVCHWLAKVGEPGKPPRLVSLVTADYEAVRELFNFNTQSEVMLLCLQLK